MSALKRKTITKTPMVPFSTELGVYLKNKREEAGYTQIEVARFLDHSSPMMVSKWERGVCGPKFTDLVKLVDYFHISPQEMMQMLMEEQEKLFKSYIYKRSIS